MLITIENNGNIKQINGDKYGISEDAYPYHSDVVRVFEREKMDEIIKSEFDGDFAPTPPRVLRVSYEMDTHQDGFKDKLLTSAKNGLRTAAFDKAEDLLLQQIALLAPGEKTQEFVESDQAREIIKTAANVLMMYLSTNDQIVKSDKMREGMGSLSTLLVTKNATQISGEAISKFGETAKMVTTEILPLLYTAVTGEEATEDAISEEFGSITKAAEVVAEVAEVASVSNSFESGFLDE